MLYRSAKLFIVNPAEELLVLTRAHDDVARRSMFDLPGGGCEKNEKALRTALREGKEEVGPELIAALEDITYLGHDRRESKSRPDVANVKHAFMAHVGIDAPEPALSYEHSAATWMPLADAERVLGHAVQREQCGLVIARLELLRPQLPELVLA